MISHRIKYAGYYLFLKSGGTNALWEQMTFIQRLQFYQDAASIIKSFYRS